MSSNDLRTIGHFSTLGEASMARNLLESAGIPATIADDYILTTDPLLAGAMNYIKVQVRASDAEQAEAVLAEPPPEIDADEVGGDADEDESSEGIDAGDEIESETRGERLVRYAYRAAMFGSVSLPFILHLYSLYLLLKAAIFYPKLPPAASRQFYVALLVDLAWIALLLIFLMAFFH